MLHKIRRSYRRLTCRSMDIACDLGTGNTLLCTPDANGNPRGPIYDEPTVAQTRPDQNFIISVGQQAKNSVGRDSGGIETLRPIKKGKVEDPDLALAMLTSCLRNFLDKQDVPTSLKLEMVMTVPIGLNTLEEKTVARLALDAGAQRVLVVDQLIASAIGAGYYRPDSRDGCCFIDIGAGTHQVAILSNAGIIKKASVLIDSGGDAYTEALQKFLSEEFSIDVGEFRAEEAKMKVGAALCLGEEDDKSFEILGSDPKTGLGKSLMIKRSQLVPAFELLLSRLVIAIKRACRNAPIEIRADMADSKREAGIIIAGGGSELHNLDVFLLQETGLKVKRVAQPQHAVVLGAAKMLRSRDLMQSFGREPVIPAHRGGQITRLELATAH